MKVNSLLSWHPIMDSLKLSNNLLTFHILVTHENNSVNTTEWHERTIISSYLYPPMITVTGYGISAAATANAANIIATSYMESGIQ